MSDRTLGEMSWALRNLPGTEDLADYECSVNALCHEYDCTLACAYDINLFRGRAIADARPFKTTCECVASAPTANARIDGDSISSPGRALNADPVLERVIVVVRSRAQR